MAVVAGGVLALGGATVFDRSVDPSALHPPDAGASLDVDAFGGGSAVALATESQRVAGPPPSPELAPDPDVLDVAALTAAVRRAAEEAATQGRAADGRRAGEPGDEAEAGERARREAEYTPSAGRAIEEGAERSSRSSRRSADGCELNPKGLGEVKPHVRSAAELLGCRYGEPELHGIAGRGGPSDHPRGLAIDFMVDRATGDALAECAMKNKEALGIAYAIWRQRMNDGSGWENMEDRGGATANHLDHVHISFGRGGGTGSLTGC